MNITNKTRKLIIAFFLFGFAALLQAQESFSATSGNATGIDGTISYTVGQVNYSTSIASNGTVAQGVQQPFEIMIVTSIDNIKDFGLECLIYPNPTTNFLTLYVENFSLPNLHSQLYNINGKLLQNKKVESKETFISMENLVPSTYFLKVINGNKEAKIFKIVKN